MAAASRPALETQIEDLARAARAASRETARARRARARTPGSCARPSASRPPASASSPPTARTCRRPRRAASMPRSRSASSSRRRQVDVDMLAGLRDVAALPDPVGEIDEHARAPERAARRPHAHPARRDRDHLRVAPQRDGRRGGAVREGGQRGDPARRLRGDPLEPGARRGAARRGARDAASPRTRSQSCPTTDRAAIDHLLRAGPLHRSDDPARRPGADPQGGREVDASRSIKHDAGVCHVFLDASADREMARAIVRDSKIRQMAVCNGLETLLVHRGRRAHACCPRARRRCTRRASRSAAAARTREVFADARAGQRGGLVRGVPRRRSSRCASSTTSTPRSTHIRRYGSNHTEVIVTSDYANAQAFAAARRLVDGRRELLDGLRRRLPPRPRRRDRHLDLEAARLRPDGPRGAHDAEVRALRRRPAPRMSAD